MTRIARDLRDWRLYCDLTQDQAARRLGVSLRTYSGYETGTRVPPYRMWQRLRSVIAMTSKNAAYIRDVSRG